MGSRGVRFREAGIANVPEQLDDSNGPELFTQVCGLHIGAIRPLDETAYDIVLAYDGAATAAGYPVLC